MHSVTDTDRQTDGQQDDDNTVQQYDQLITRQEIAEHENVGHEHDEPKMSARREIAGEKSTALTLYCMNNVSSDGKI